MGLAVGTMHRGVLILALAPTGSPCSSIWQNPRFIARKRGATVEIRCHTKDLGAVSWLRKREMDLEPKPLLLDKGRVMQSQNGSIATLTIQGVQFQDNGIYFCQQKCSKMSFSRGCGTELRVMGVFGACPPAREGEGPMGPRSLPGAIRTLLQPSLPPVGGAHREGGRSHSLDHSEEVLRGAGSRSGPPASSPPATSPQG